MAITVKHSKVSTIPDDADTSLVRPSDWNADHTLVGTVPVDNGGTGAATLTGYVKGNGTANMTAAATIPSTDITGLGTMAAQNSNNISVTGGSISGTTVSGYIPTTEKAAALGVATLDAGGTVPLSQIPASIQGGVSYQGTWNASTNTPTLTNGVGTKGYYYVVSVAGNTNLDGITSWNVGDWAIFNGTVWQKVDNTDAVTSVNGYTGTVVLTNTDISGFGSMSTQNANAVAITGGTINGTTIGATTATTGAFTTATASTSVTTPIVQATNSGGLALRNSAGTTQISMGGGGGDNVSINVPTNINGANAQIDISPTGTGHVHIKPTGTGSLEIAPTNAGTMNNMVIGGTTPLAITGTTITATSFVGSGASLTNVVNSAAAGTGISVSASTGAVTITNTAPDQTVSIAAGTGISTSGTYPSFTVTNTAPDQVVSLTGAGTTSISGTYPNFTVTSNDQFTGTVTSVTGTSPVVSSGGNTPAISMPAATGSVNGYLTSTDWTTFNSKGAGTVTSITAGTGLTGGTITGSGTIAIDSTVATLTGTQSLQNKTLDITNTVTLSDALFTLQDDADTTKQAVFQLSGITTATTRTYTLPNLTGSLATIGNLAQTFAGNTTFSNATLSLGTSTAAGTYTLGNGATISGATRTINIGTAGVAGSTTAVNIGGTANTSTTTVNGVFITPVPQASNGIIVNSKTISASYTIAATDNAMSAGPVTIASGQTVTVSSGSRWVVL
jgi:hypothetical protein